MPVTMLKLARHADADRFDFALRCGLIAQFGGALHHPAEHSVVPLMGISRNRTTGHNFANLVNDSKLKG